MPAYARNPTFKPAQLGLGQDRAFVPGRRHSNHRRDVAPGIRQCPPGANHSRTCEIATNEFAAPFPNNVSVLFASLYLARFQMSVAVPPADAGADKYFSSSPEMTKGRFCSVLSQFGNVAFSMWKVKLLSASLTV